MKKLTKMTKTILLTAGLMLLMIKCINLLNLIVDKLQTLKTAEEFFSLYVSIMTIGLIACVLGFSFILMIDTIVFFFKYMSAKNA